MSKRKAGEPSDPNSLPGSSYFLGIEPQNLNPRDYVEHRMKETPYLRIKDAIKEWHDWSQFFCEKPMWKDAFASVEVFTLNTYRTWQASTSKDPIRTRSLSKRAAVSSSTSASHTPNMEDLPLGLPSLPPPPPSPPPPILPSSSSPPLSSHQASSPASSGSSPSGSSSSQASTKSLPPAVLSQMRNDFTRSFNGYRGNQWKLSSGTIVDDVFYSYVMNMRSESSLHSLIITGEPDLEPFSPDDGLLIKEFLKESDLAHIDVCLSSWKKAELLQYQLGRDEMITLLKNGLGNLRPLEDNDIDKNEFDTF
ncbi:hypothetical protein BGZ80_003520, partial [Entomortierella chlamydospora]